VVSSGLYLTRSTSQIQKLQSPVGCMSTGGLVGWTSKVTLFRSSVSNFCIQELPMSVFIKALSFVCLLAYYIGQGKIANSLLRG